MAAERADARDVDQVPRALRAQLPRGRLRDPQRAEEVRLQRLARGGLVELLDHPERHRPGVVDDDVEGPADRFERGEHGRAVGDVDPIGLHALGQVAAGEARDAVAALQRGLGERAAEAAAGAGDEPGSGHGRARYKTNRLVSNRYVGPMTPVPAQRDLPPSHPRRGAGADRGGRLREAEHRGDRLPRRRGQADDLPLVAVQGRGALRRRARPLRAATGRRAARHGRPRGRPQARAARDRRRVQRPAPGPPAARAGARDRARPAARGSCTASASTGRCTSARRRALASAGAATRTSTSTSPSS